MASDDNTMPFISQVTFEKYSCAHRSLMSHLEMNERETSRQSADTRTCTNSEADGLATRLRNGNAITGKFQGDNKVATVAETLSSSSPNRTIRREETSPDARRKPSIALPDQTRRMTLRSADKLTTPK